MLITLDLHDICGYGTSRAEASHDFFEANVSPLVAPIRIDRPIVEGAKISKSSTCLKRNFRNQCMRSSLKMLETF